MSFWGFATRRAQSGAEETILRIDGVIAGGEDGVDWFGDAVTGSTAFARALSERPGPVTVEINSPGGDVFAGIDIYYHLCRHPGKVRVVVSWAASMASIIAQAAAPGALEIMPGAMMMIHEPWTSARGNAEDLEKEASVLREITDGMVGIYMQRYKGTEAQLREALAREEYLGAQRAVECGLCDAVADVSPGMAAMDAGRICAMADAGAMERWREMSKARASQPDATRSQAAAIAQRAAAMAQRHKKTQL